MTDLLQVLVNFPTAPFSHLLPSLDKALITTSDLLTLDAFDIAKRAQLPPAQVNKLADAILQALHHDLDIPREAERLSAAGECMKDAAVAQLQVTRVWHAISTLDPKLDATLGGGIPTGHVTEITGESGAGKTQFLLTLLLSSQLAPPRGISRPSVYISTEAALSTSRLSQILRLNPVLSALGDEEKPTLNRVLSIQTPDLESQDHILRYQVPVAVQRQNVGLIVIDSIASNYRAELELHGADLGKLNTGARPDIARNNRRGPQAMAERRTQLVQLGGFLRNLARTENIAIVVSNQVADRFTHTSNSLSPHPSGQNPPRATPTLTPDPLSLDHQQRWFTGWGDLPIADEYQTNFKTPSLGLVWTNQISARIALIKESSDRNGERKRKRWLRVVFAPWVAATRDIGQEYEITAEGVKAITEDKKSDAC